MFDKNEFLQECELSQAGIEKKKREIIIKVLYELMNYELEEINKDITNTISSKVENIEFLFKRDNSKQELFEELEFNLQQCLNYWDDGFFDPYSQHFSKFLKIKLELN